MIDQIEIERFLIKSFEDAKLSNDEKYSLKSLLESLKSQEEMFSYTRNKAFDIFREAQDDEENIFIRSTNWLEKVIKTIDSARNQNVVKASSAFFSPGKSCAKAIIDCIYQAKHSIDICVFTISDNQISDAILKAHKSGIAIRIISDNDKANDMGSDVYQLTEQGVPVRLDQSPHHMHHKFALFDRQVLLNGSFNWTRSASMKNEENITLLHDKNLISAFATTFEDLWDECK